MRSIQWMITGHCNLSCRHCYLTGCADSNAQPDLEQLTEMMDRLRDEGVREVVLTGGEPLSRPDIAQVIRQLHARGIGVSRVITNGYLLTDDLLTLLEELGQSPVFNISYDGDGGAHDALRRRNGAGEAALKAFRLCARRGFQTACDMTVHRGSAPGLSDSLRTLDRCGCSLVKVMPIFPLGNGSRAADDMLLSGEAFLDLVCETIVRYYEDDLSLALYLSGCFYGQGAGGGWTMPMLVLDQCQDPLSAALCRRDSEIAFLSASGRVMPCPGMVALGDEAGQFAKLEDLGLDEAKSYGGFARLMNYTVAEHMRSNAECASCRHVRSCGGGCRTAAIAFDKSFTGRDPYTCAFFREGGPARIREAVAQGMLLRAIGNDTTRG